MELYNFIPQRDVQAPILPETAAVLCAEVVNAVCSKCSGVCVCLCLWTVVSFFECLYQSVCIVMKFTVSKKIKGLEEITKIKTALSYELHL